MTDPQAKSDPRSFLAGLVGTKERDCIRWPYRLNADGYGYTYRNSRWIGAHRLMCILAHGAPAQGLEASHECGNRWCVNPAHLAWKTRSENASDRLRHGTDHRGAKSPSAKLSEDDARYIIASTERVMDLARQFGVSERTIHRIKTGARWGHLRWSDEARKEAA